jgi:lipoprotein NlpD
MVALAGCAAKVPAPVSDRPGKPVIEAKPAVPQEARKPQVEPEPVKQEPSQPVVRFTGAKPESYTVQKGDTLFSIARELGVDYKDLAAWNQLESPSLIKVGQVLRLKPGGSESAPVAVALAPVSTAPKAEPLAEASPVTVRPVQPAVATAPASLVQPPAEAALRPMPKQPVLSEPQAVKRPYTAQTLVEMPASPPAPTPKANAADTSARTRLVEGISWTWPAQGKLLGEFSESGNNKGLEIGGDPGQPVLAASGGKVVYSGSGLRGYGKLIIIRHNETYLSAYAHNRDILVKEGESVSQGQKIAEMGDTDADQVKLRFEIREGGKPVDPMKFLPVP